MEPESKRVKRAKTRLLDYILAQGYSGEDVDLTGLNAQTIFEIIKDIHPLDLYKIELSRKSIRAAVVKAYPIYWKYWYERSFPKNPIDMSDPELMKYLDTLSINPDRQDTYYKRAYEYQEKRYKNMKLEHINPRRYQKKIPFIVSKGKLWAKDINTFCLYNNIYTGVDEKNLTKLLVFNINKKEARVTYKEDFIFYSNTLKSTISLAPDRYPVINNKKLKISLPETDLKIFYDDLIIFLDRSIIVLKGPNLIQDKTSDFSQSNIQNIHDCYPYFIVTTFEHGPASNSQQDYYKIYSLENGDFIPDIILDYTEFLPFHISNTTLYLFKKSKKLQLIEYDIIKKEIRFAKDLFINIAHDFLTANQVVPNMYISKSTVFDNRYIFIESKYNRRSRGTQVIYVVDLQKNLLFIFFKLNPGDVFGGFTPNGELFYYNNYIYETREVLEKRVNQMMLVSCKICFNEASIVCGGCMKSKYCSKECQVIDWENYNHKDECK